MFVWFLFNYFDFRFIREAEQMKLLYERLNQASSINSTRFHRRNPQEFSPLEPRRSNPLDRYQLSE